MIAFCSIYCIKVFWFNIQLAKKNYIQIVLFYFYAKRFCFCFFPLFLNLGPQIRRPQIRYIEFKSAPDRLVGQIAFTLFTANTAII